MLEVCANYPTYIEKAPRSRYDKHTMMIQAQQLTKQYGSFTAVSSVSFGAQTGEVVGLLGPNGAGKTSIMRMLTGYTPPTSGTARIADFDILTDPLDVRERIGYLPERVPLYPDMTVEEYLTYWAELRGMNNRKTRQARVLATLERVYLTDKRKKLVRSLSKGMRQRLGIAQAIVHNPPVIILDEPTIGIDPRQVIEVRQMVRELGREHCVLFSTHILTEAEQVCDRLLILNQGKIVAQGTPNELRYQLQQGAGLYIEFAAHVPTEHAARVFAGVSGLLDATPQGNGWNLTTHAPDIREQLFDQAAQVGCPIIELRPITLTLEDIFLNIIGDA